MAHRVVWKIAAPMIGLGVVLLVLGAFAAYNVHEQQRTSSEVVSHQAHAMLALHELNIVMREIRFQVVEFLRTGDTQHLNDVTALHDSADTLLARTKQLAQAGRERERERTDVVETGYRAFFKEYQPLYTQLAVRAQRASDSSLVGPLVPTPEEVDALTRATDQLLTTRVLKPLEDGIGDNRRFVEETNQASLVTAQHLKIGFLLLGICGAVAGLLLGTVIARTIGRSIVQLNITVRSVAGRLSDVTGPVTFSHTGDLRDINFGLQGLERDIADLIQRLQSRETELLRSEQLAKVGQLAAGLAHELRNPLMPMKILVQAALERGDGIGLKGRSLEVIDQEISRLEESIRSFLDYARPPVPHKLPTDLREIVSGTVELAMGRARLQHVTIEMTLPEEPLPALIDRGQVRQLLLNLLLNALDALPDGGHIECAVEACRDEDDGNSELEPAEEPLLASSFTEHDALRLLARPGHRPAKVNHPCRLEIRVTDNGPGIPASAVAGVFEPFMTTKETGTGLGLSVSRRIAQAHDGELTVRNHPTGGAEFTLRLPCCE
jgi:two-component system sensor histidine kinase HydH